MAKKDKKDSDGKPGGKGKDKAPDPDAPTNLDPAPAPAPTPAPPPAATGNGGRTVVRAVPRTVGETVATASLTADTGSSAPVSVDTATPVGALTDPADGPAGRVAGSPTSPTSTALARRTPPAAPAASSELSADDVAEALLVPLRIARRVLPERRTPVALGVAALALVGVVDLPVAVGIGLGWEALRRWGPADPPARRD